MPFKHIKVNARTVIQNPNQEILLLKRCEFDKDRPGTWDLPGGKLKFGENPKDTATRETLEETGLFIANIVLLDVLSNIESKTTHKLTHVYHSEIKENLPDITLSEREHTEYIWCKPEEICGYDLPKKYIYLIGEKIILNS